MPRVSIASGRLPGNEKGEEFGEQRLADLLVAHRHEPAAEIVERVIQAVAEWIAGAPPADDVTIVVARRLD